MVFFYMIVHVSPSFRGFYTLYYTTKMFIRKEQICMFLLFFCFLMKSSKKVAVMATFLMGNFTRASQGASSRHTAPFNAYSY